MIYDYIIIGLGPTGITLGLNLLKTNKKVLFIEADNKIGGCWKTDFTNDGYFTEHSPKVLSKSGSKEFNKLLHFLDITPKYKKVYENSNIYNDHIVGIREGFSWKDIVNVLVYLLLYIISMNDKTITLQNWCKLKNISEKAQNYINIRSIAISNTYDKLTIDAFIRFFVKRYEYIFDLDQLESPEGWLEASYVKLNENSNFTILTNTRVKQLMISDDGTVSGVLTNNNDVHFTKNIIACVPLRSLYTIMYNSSYPNWFQTLHGFKEYVSHSSYTGIGFQLHYTDKRQLPPKWCWSCHGDWKVIILDKTNFLKTFSKDPEIKMVLSCVVVDMDTKSKHIKKTANECESINEIVNEAFRQMNELSDNLFMNPKKITTSNNLFYSNEFGWESLNSSYSPSSHVNVSEGLPYKGKLKNLYSVGPHNLNEVVVIETAIKSAKLFSTKVLNIENVF